MIELLWRRTDDGRYQTHVTSPDDTLSRTWEVRLASPKRWSIQSTTIVRVAAPDTYRRPPVSIDTAYHGTAYTLREAKELVASFTYRSTQLQEA